MNFYIFVSEPLELGRCANLVWVCHFPTKSTFLEKNQFYHKCSEVGTYYGFPIECHEETTSATIQLNSNMSIRPTIQENVFMNRSSCPMNQFKQLSSKKQTM
ncbi:unnamed protein product [Caenorhabditis angaria]|uniref:Uncharacterized protein n=1 Tax=Caenorhabditis angaria TaxID=860376 RepID=A0A9P1MXV0_9PELO|nr:unnamed protein product [Caenorhabditis angaria]